MRRVTVSACATSGKPGALEKSLEMCLEIVLVNTRGCFGSDAPGECLEVAWKATAIKLAGMVFEKRLGSAVRTCLGSDAPGMWCGKHLRQGAPGEVP